MYVRLRFHRGPRLSTEINELKKRLSLFSSDLKMEYPLPVVDSCRGIVRLP
jgi:hypothetical protein